MPIKTAGGSPAASYLLLRRQKKVTKKKAIPVCRPCWVPCVARQVRRLRNSRYALRQSSPKPPDPSALLGGAQGKFKSGVVCAARTIIFDFVRQVIYGYRLVFTHLQSFR